MGQRHLPVSSSGSHKKKEWVITWSQSRRVLTLTFFFFFYMCEWRKQYLETSHSMADLSRQATVQLDCHNEISRDEDVCFSCERWQLPLYLSWCISKSVLGQSPGRELWCSQFGLRRIDVWITHMLMCIYTVTKCVVKQCCIIFLTDINVNFIM